MQIFTLHGKFDETTENAKLFCSFCSYLLGITYFLCPEEEPLLSVLNKLETTTISTHAKRTCLKFSSLGQLIFSFYIRIFVKTMTLRTKIDQLIKSVDLLRTEVQNINSKLDSMGSRLAKQEDKVENQQETFSEKILKKADIKEVSILKKQVEELENELKFSVQK